MSVSVGALVHPALPCDERIHPWDCLPWLESDEQVDDTTQNKDGCVKFGSWTGSFRTVSLTHIKQAPGGLPFHPSYRVRHRRHAMRSTWHSAHYIVLHAAGLLVPTLFTSSLIVRRWWLHHLCWVDSVEASRTRSGNRCVRTGKQTNMNYYWTNSPTAPLALVLSSFTSTLEMESVSTCSDIFLGNVEISLFSTNTKWRILLLLFLIV